MPRAEPIQIEADSWMLMRNPSNHPVAIVNRITDTTGEARFLVLTWHANPAMRRMTGIYTSLEDADSSVTSDTAPVERVHRMNAGPPNGRPAQHSPNGRRA